MEPIKKNHHLTLKISANDSNGNGVSFYNKKRIITPNSVIHDVVHVKIIKVAANYAIAKLSKIITPSPSVSMPPATSQINVAVAVPSYLHGIIN